MSSAMEEEEADLRDDLRGRPFERITLVEDGVRWMGVHEDLGGSAEEGQAGEKWGKGRKDDLRVSVMGVDREENGGASEGVTGLLVARYRHRWGCGRETFLG
jgi:hypothetical protein